MCGRCVCGAGVTGHCWCDICTRSMQDKEERTGPGADVLSQHSLYTGGVTVTTTEGWCPPHHWSHCYSIIKSELMSGTVSTIPHVVLSYIQCACL